MGDQSTRFEELDARIAANVAGAAKRFGIKQIVYLGGLGSKEQTQSNKPLRSSAPWGCSCLFTVLSSAQPCHRVSRQVWRSLSGGRIGDYCKAGMSGYLQASH